HAGGREALVEPEHVEAPAQVVAGRAGGRRQVAERAAVALPAAARTPPDDDRAAQPHAEEDVEVRGQPGADAVVALAQRRGGRVVLEEHGRGQAAREQRPDRDALPAGEALGVDHVVDGPVDDAQRPGEADPHAPQAARVDASRELRDGLDDEVDRLVGAGEAALDVDARAYLAREVDQEPGEVAAVEVDADAERAALPDREQGGGAPAGALALSALAHAAPDDQLADQVA